MSKAISRDKFIKLVQKSKVLARYTSPDGTKEMRFYAKKDGGHRVRVYKLRREVEP